jgi:predicted restriction endonuclease
MKSACLDCGRPSDQKRCEVHRAVNGSPSSWGKTRSRTAQARFRRAVLELAGGRCQYMRNGVRCPATEGLQAQHQQRGSDDPATGMALCRDHYKALDRCAR